MPLNATDIQQIQRYLVTAFGPEGRPDLESKLSSISGLTRSQRDQVIDTYLDTLAAGEHRDHSALSATRQFAGAFRNLDQCTDWAQAVGEDSNVCSSYIFSHPGSGTDISFAVGGDMGFGFVGEYTHLFPGVGLLPIQENADVLGGGIEILFHRTIENSGHVRVTYQHPLNPDQFCDDCNIGIFMVTAGRRLFLP